MGSSTVHQNHRSVIDAQPQLSATKPQLFRQKLKVWHEAFLIPNVGARLRFCDKEPLGQFSLCPFSSLCWNWTLPTRDIATSNMAIDEAQGGKCARRPPLIDKGARSNRAFYHWLSGLMILDLKLGVRFCEVHPQHSFDVVTSFPHVMGRRKLVILFQRRGALQNLLSWTKQCGPHLVEVANQAAMHRSGADLCVNIGSDLF